MNNEQTSKNIFTHNDIILTELKYFNSFVRVFNFPNIFQVKRYTITSYADSLKEIKEQLKNKFLISTNTANEA